MFTPADEYSPYYDEDVPSDESDVEEIPPTRRGHPILAWIAITLLVSGELLLPWILQRGAKNEARDSANDLITMETQARSLIGAGQWMGDRSSLSPQVEALNTGSIEQRLRFIVVVGEVAGTAEARKQLRLFDEKMIEHQRTLSPEAAEVRRLLGKLYTDYEAKRFEAPSLTVKERELLRERLGWFGEVALAPAGGPNVAAREAALAPVRRSSLLTWIVVAVVAVGGFVGLVGLIALLALLATGQLGPRFQMGSEHGGIYAETFAVWMFLFLVLSIGGAFVPFREGRILLAACVSFLSLSALGWPVLRGVPWREVRADLGLFVGRRGWLEPILGVGSYVITLPLLVGGLLVTALLVTLQKRWQHLEGPDYFGPGNSPSHPIVELGAHGNGLVWLQLFFVACVAAPIVEEIMFRGVLYRHLREASGRLPTLLSALMSAIWVSFIFAVIHPQGWLGIPLLMPLALGLTLAREWRGTLVPSMVMHGFSNGLTLLLLMATTGK